MLVQFDRPRGIGLLSNGNVVVGDSGNHRLSIFDQQGSFIKIIGAGQLLDPFHIFIDSDDRILVANYSDYGIRILKSSTGNLLKTIPLKSTGITMNQNGRIIASGESHTVSIF